MQAKNLILHDFEICDYSDRLLGAYYFVVWPQQGNGGTPWLAYRTSEARH